MESTQSRCKILVRGSWLYGWFSFKGKDDQTGEALTQRDDDKPEVILSRLNTYDKNTKPIVDFYK